MADIVADTHAIIWYLTRDLRLSGPANNALDSTTQAGDTIFVPAICLVEIVYLVEKGRVPVSARQVLLEALDDPSKPARFVEMSRAVVDTLEKASRAEVPDMPDRINAATALALDLPLVSRDGKIRSSQVQTIW